MDVLIALIGLVIVGQLVVVAYYKGKKDGMEAAEKSLLEMNSRLPLDADVWEPEINRRKIEPTESAWPTVEPVDDLRW